MVTTPKIRVRSCRTGHIEPIEWADLQQAVRNRTIDRDDAIDFSTGRDDWRRAADTKLWARTHPEEVGQARTEPSAWLGVAFPPGSEAQATVQCPACGASGLVASGYCLHCGTALQPGSDRRSVIRLVLWTLLAALVLGAICGVVALLLWVGQTTSVMVD